MTFSKQPLLRPLPPGRSLCIGLSLWLTALATHAADATWPPDWGATATYEQGRRNPDYDDDQIKLGDETIYVGVSTLSGLRKTLGGRGRIRARPGATEHSEGDRWLCYTVAGDARKLRLWLGGSSAHVNGPDVLSDYVVEALPASATPTPSCPRLPARFVPLTLDHGVQLGAPAADLVAAMPPLQHEGDDWVMATSYVSKHWVVSRLWAMRVVSGRIVGVRVHAMVTS